MGKREREKRIMYGIERDRGGGVRRKKKGCNEKRVGGEKENAYTLRERARERERESERDRGQQTDRPTDRQKENPETKAGNALKREARQLKMLKCTNEILPASLVSWKRLLQRNTKRSPVSVWLSGSVSHWRIYCCYGDELLSELQMTEDFTL